MTTLTKTQATTPVDPAARLAALQAAETKALAGVSSAAAALAKKRERHAEIRARHEAEEREHVERLEAAQGAYAAVAGPERAAAVLDITLTAARQLAKAHETDGGQAGKSGGDETGREDTTGADASAGEGWPATA